MSKQISHAAWKRGECSEPKTSLCLGSARFINVEALVRPIDAGSIAMAGRLVKRDNAYPRLIEALRFEMERYDAEGEYKRSEPIRDILRELGEL